MAICVSFSIGFKGRSSELDIGAPRCGCRFAPRSRPERLELPGIMLRATHHMFNTTRASSDIRLGSQGGSHTTLTATGPTPGNAGHGVLHHGRQFLGGRTVRRRQRHVDIDRAIVGDVDPVDQAELVDVGRNLGIVDGLDRGHDLVGETRHVRGCRAIGPAARRRRRGLGSVRRRGGRRSVPGIVSHVKKSCAFLNATARLSTSSRVL